MSPSVRSPVICSAPSRTSKDGVSVQTTISLDIGSSLNPRPVKRTDRLHLPSTVSNVEVSPAARLRKAWLHDGEGGAHEDERRDSSFRFWRLCGRERHHVLAVAHFFCASLAQLFIFRMHALYKELSCKALPVGMKPAMRIEGSKSMRQSSYARQLDEVDTLLIAEEDR